ncbi:phthalate transporter [Aspergillus terreus]|uniref:Phthalate transporter n=1 Tax=Aspergillus terreus TaxID=33178 RepID=A0A5M3YRZ5_ASPTE|nr:hypothetical protein ATETN484_0002014900 [Aspergillus terreus]GFF14932.1 phthalate transporter [Aspergillus terreus]
MMGVVEAIPLVACICFPPGTVNTQITRVVGLLTYFLVVDFPDKSHMSWRFLSEDEAAFIIRRLNIDRDDAVPGDSSLREFLRHGVDMRLWCYGLIFSCPMAVMYAITFSLPLILGNGMGAGSETSIGTDRSFLLMNGAGSIIGLALMGLLKGNGWRYYGVFLATSTTNASVTACMTWQSNNIRGQWKRALSSAIMVGTGASEAWPAVWSFGVRMRRPIPPAPMPPSLTGLVTACFICANREADRNAKVLGESPNIRYTL